MILLALVLAGWFVMAEAPPAGAVGAWECSQLGDAERIERGLPVRCDSAGRLLR